MNFAKAQCTILMVLAVTLCSPAGASEIAPTVEVFIGSTTQGVSGSVTTTVYVIDRIHQLQQTLSRDLPADPAKAKQLALKRFQTMDAQLSRELENAAKGLVQARQYGIDRYPAIVFEGQAVVYGVTDLDTAKQLYGQWQERSR